MAQRVCAEDYDVNMKICFCNKTVRNKNENCYDTKSAHPRESFDVIITLQAANECEAIRLYGNRCSRSSINAFHLMPPYSKVVIALCSN